MASDRQPKALEEALARNPNRIGGLIGALDEEPHVAKAADVCTEDQARGIIAASHSSLSDQELSDLVHYWGSPAGKKEAELADSMAARFRSGERSPSTASAASPESEKLARELISNADVSGLMATFSGPFQMAPEHLQDFLVASYAEASPSEIQEMLAFHRSPVGQKAIQAARSAVSDIGKRFGL